MRPFVAPGQPTPRSGTSSVLLRTPGTSMTRMRCRASNRSIVLRSRSTRLSAGSWEVCGRQAKASSIPLQRPRNPGSQRVPSQVPHCALETRIQRRQLPVPLRQNGPASSLLRTPLHPKPHASREPSESKLPFHVALTAARYLVSRLRRKAIASDYAYQLTAREPRV